MISLTLPLPPSVNRHPRQHYLPKAVKDFRCAVAAIVASEGVKPIIGRMDVTVRVSGHSARPFDLDNRIKPLFDALQLAGCFPNDNAIDRFEVLRDPPIKGGACKVLILARTGT